MDAEEGKSFPRPHIPPTSENLEVFANLCTNSIIKQIFSTTT